MMSQSFFKGEAFLRIRGLEKRLMELPHTDTTLADTKLESMGIRRTHRLNIDDPSAIDTWPIFFQPLQDSPDFQKAVAVTEGEVRLWSHCPNKLEHVDRLSCALQTTHWLASTVLEAVGLHHLYPADALQWKGQRQIALRDAGLHLGQKANSMFLNL
jgi:hypothetical protein